MIFVVLYFVPSGLLALCLAAVVAWDRLRPRRRVSVAPYGGKLVYSPLPLVSLVELERLRSGAAFAEAMLLQRDEIRALPEVRRPLWS